MILMRHSDVEVHCIFTTGTANSAHGWWLLFFFVGVGAIRKKAGRLCVARASRACARNRPTKDGADSGDDDDEEKSKPLRECLSAEANSFFFNTVYGCVCV